ncbi:MAG: hypothetical protein R3F49_00990 [Planctomycetota bacterium]
MHSRSKNPRSPLPVLLVGADGIEFLSTDEQGSRFARLAEPIEPGASAATRALNLVKSVKCEPGPCILALGSSILHQRVLGLPQTPPKELRVVLQRKAAMLIDAAPEETLYAALPLDVEEGAKERKWMLLALRRSHYLALRYALREKGFSVRRVVSERMALASAAETVIDHSANESCLAVGMEGGATGVHLLHGGELVHQSVLTTRFDDDASMAKVLVQELRGFDAFWRRRSRGGSIDRVVLVGFAPRWAERLEFAVRAALPSSKIQRLVRESTEGMRAARMVALAACRSVSPVQISIDVPLAPLRSRVALVAAASAVMASVAAYVSFDDARGHRDRIIAEQRALQEQAATCDQLVADQGRVRSAMEELALQRKRAEFLGRHGIPLEATLRDALTLVGDSAALTSFSVASDGEDAGIVKLAGEMPSAPVAAQTAIDGMLARAQQSALLTNFEVATPRMSGTMASTLAFHGEATLKEGQ